MTAAEVRDLLVGEGWKVCYEGRDGWNAENYTAPSLITYHADRRIPFDISWGSNLFHGPLPSTPADLWALLRCVGAPVPEVKGLPDVVAMSDVQPRKGCVHYSYIGPERRHAEHPAMVPCKKTGMMLDDCYKCARYGGRVPPCCFTVSEYLLFNGRRATDWRKGEGK